jgi:hypothetical protein
VISTMVREEAEENRIMEPSISIFSEPNSGKSLVIIKNNLIDFFFRFILSIHNFFLVSRHTRKRNRNVPQ